MRSTAAVLICENLCLVGDLVSVSPTEAVTLPVAVVALGVISSSQLGDTMLCSSPSHLSLLLSLSTAVFVRRPRGGIASCALSTTSRKSRSLLLRESGVRAFSVMERKGIGESVGEGELVGEESFLVSLSICNIVLYSS